jgi:hypothetical protein
MRLRLLFALALLAPAAARAAGGAHVVDDSEVEASGWCHLELWGSALSHGGTLGNLGPACTPAAVPWLEIDGFVTHYDPSRGSASESIGFGPKITLRPQSEGVGVGLTGTMALDASKGRVAYAVANLPVTVPIGPRFRVNVNVGAQWTRGVHGLGMSEGAQVEYTPERGPELMGEVFRVGGGPVGFQTGPRWTVDRGRIDLDVLVARYPDGVSPAALTLGVTIRRQPFHH